MAEVVQIVNLVVDIAVRIVVQYHRDRLVAAFRQQMDEQNHHPPSPKPHQLFMHELAEKMDVNR